MKFKEVKNDLASIVNYATFYYNGKLSGIDPISKEHFNLWYGPDKTYTAKSIDEAMEYPLFDGKSFFEIFDDIVDLEVT